MLNAQFPMWFEYAWHSTCVANFCNVRDSVLPVCVSRLREKACTHATTKWFTGLYEPPFKLCANGKPVTAQLALGGSDKLQLHY